MGLKNVWCFSCQGLGQEDLITRRFYQGKDVGVYCDDCWKKATQSIKPEEVVSGPND